MLHLQCNVPLGHLQADSDSESAMHSQGLGDVTDTQRIPSVRPDVHVYRGLLWHIIHEILSESYVLPMKAEEIHFSKWRMLHALLSHAC